MAKDKLKSVAEGWSPKKGFLEGAYRILVFGNTKIQNGEVKQVLENEDDEVNKI